MQFTASYKSPLGNILIAADDEGLTGLWFEGQKYFAQGLGKNTAPVSLSEQSVIPSKKPVIPSEVEGSFSQTNSWLNIYFSGNIPNFIPKIHFIGTDFQKSVWEILFTIPYGKTMSYGEIAKLIAKRRGIEKMSARAVGGAVGRNPISIIVPCHRVIGSNGKLTGYAGGIEKKIELLKIEGSR